MFPVDIHLHLLADHRDVKERVNIPAAKDFGANYVGHRPRRYLISKQVEDQMMLVLVLWVYVFDLVKELEGEMAWSNSYGWATERLFAFD